MCKNELFSKFKNEKRIFKNIRTKIELYANFNNVNNNLT